MVKYFLANMSDPIRIDEWVKEIEKAFEACPILKDQKLDYVVFMLRGIVVDWWKLTLRTFGSIINMDNILRHLSQEILFL